MPVDVQALDADFYVFSGHKVFAPTGIGALYAQAELLERDAALAGRRQHDQRRHVRAAPSTRTPPARFEAGTGNIADAVGLGAAIDYVSRLGLASIAAYEHQLLEYATGSLAPFPACA